MGIITDIVPLDATSSVGAAKARLKDNASPWVVVRRSLGLVVFWYAYPRDWVLERFVFCPDSASLEDGLNLHEHSSAPDKEAEAILGPVDKATVVRDAFGNVGVLPPGASPSPSLDQLAFQSLTVPQPVPPPRANRSHAASGPPPMEDAKPASGGLLGRILTVPSQVLGRVFRTPVDLPAGGGADVGTARMPYPGGTGGASGPGTGRIRPGTERTDGAAGLGGLQSTGSGAAADEPLEPFSAYPRMELPSEPLAPLQAFTLTVGLSPEPQAGTSGGRVTAAVPASAKTLDMEVMVIAQGFGMPKGARHPLSVDRANPAKQSADIPLVAPDTGGQPLLSTLTVVYYYGKSACGIASRNVAVVPQGIAPYADPRENGKVWVAEPASGGTVSIVPGAPAPDLTVIIAKPDGNPASGMFSWSFQSPHAVKLPREPIGLGLGTDAAQFANHLIGAVQTHERQGSIDLEMPGIGKLIADAMPPEFPDLLQQVAAAVRAKEPKAAPKVQFLTAESRIPWELAWVDPPLDPSAPPYLGCQTDMARWPLSAKGAPPLPPAHAIPVARVAVVIGDYASSNNWRELTHAKEEGEKLKERYQAVSLVADVDGIRKLIQAKLAADGSELGAEVVHFACHGEALGNSILDAAVILSKDARMSANWFSTSVLGARYKPFLFLNACQVGQAADMLGSFSGFAGESLRGGFRGFLGPLWSVDDELAHHIALEFYERAFGAPGKPAEPVPAILRDIRRRFDPSKEKNSSTRLAYAFFGHPGLTLQRG